MSILICLCTACLPFFHAKTDKQLTCSVTVFGTPPFLFLFISKQSFRTIYSMNQKHCHLSMFHKSDLSCDIMISSAKEDIFFSKIVIYPVFHKVYLLKQKNGK